MAHCKICNKQFAAEKSVRAHIQSLTSGDHEGIGYSTADPHIASGSKDTEENSFDKTDENTPPEETEENPLMVEPEVPDESTDTAQSGTTRTQSITCYECGGDVGSRQEVREAMQQGSTSHAWCEHCGAPITV
jgi:hypothetical protein